MGKLYTKVVSSIGDTETLEPQIQEGLLVTTRTCKKMPGTRIQHRVITSTAFVPVPEATPEPPPQREAHLSHQAWTSQAEEPPALWLQPPASE